VKLPDRVFLSCHSRNLGQAINEPVTQAVHDPDDPKIAGTLKNDSEQQTDGENPSKYP
jgi:hypothetical protein